MIETVKVIPLPIGLPRIEPRGARSGRPGAESIHQWNYVEGGAYAWSVG